jgi:hypothetical protein
VENSNGVCVRAAGGEVGSESISIALYLSSVDWSDSLLPDKLHIDDTFFAEYVMTNITQKIKKLESLNNEIKSEKSKNKWPQEQKRGRKQTTGLPNIALTFISIIC